MPARVTVQLAAISPLTSDFRDDAAEPILIL